MAREPFLEIARELSITEGFLIERVAKMKEAGVIRRIGAVLDARALGIVTTLCAASVPQDKIDIFIRAVNIEKNVTHHYERKGAYNFWFTLWGNEEADIASAILRIEKKTGLLIDRFDAKKTYKIRAVFDV